MSVMDGKIKVHLEYGDMKLDFEGSPEEVIHLIIKAVSQVYPAYSTVKKLMLTVDTVQLLKKLEGIIAFTPEGGVILLSNETLQTLSLREKILLHLTKAYAGQTLSQTDKASLSVDELLKTIGGPIGALAGRLSEMVDEGLVARIGRGEYKITTFGLKQFEDSTLNKIRKPSEKDKT